MIPLQLVPGEEITSQPFYAVLLGGGQALLATVAVVAVALHEPDGGVAFVLITDPEVPGGPHGQQPLLLLNSTSTRALLGELMRYVELAGGDQ